MRENVIEQHLVDLVKAIGGEVRKVQWIGRKGAPDRLVMLPSFCHNNVVVIGGRTIWVELKAPGEKVKPHQAREHERMRAMGQCVEVIDSIEGVEALLA